MADVDLDHLIVHVGNRLREQGADPSAADTLRRHPVIQEVVGPWPPDAPLGATPVDVSFAINAVRNASVVLARTSPNDPAAGDLDRIERRLHESLERGLVSEAPTTPGRPDEGAGDADDEVVGPWPPK